MSDPLLIGEPLQKASAALQSGVAWLLKQQADDGGWHSQSYGGLRDGAAVTAHALHTLAHLPASIASNVPIRDSKEIQNAVLAAAKFLQIGFEKSGVLASPDGSLDYPTYATAMVVIAMRAFPALADSLPREKLVTYLLEAQVHSRRGFTKDSPDFGGWDLLGPDDAQGVSTGSNVSVTCCVLEALGSEKSDEAKTAITAALDWLQRAQDSTGDGGFAFTPERSSLNNKALWHDVEREQPRSYGTATCDGLRALVASGGPADSIEQAQDWISKQKVVELVPGFEPLPAELGWKDGLRYYYAQTLARVARHKLDPQIPGEQVVKLATWLVASQKPARKWQNESARMREDDPLIATCFAVDALASLTSP